MEAQGQTLGPGNSQQEPGVGRELGAGCCTGSCSQQANYLGTPSKPRFRSGKRLLWFLVCLLEGSLAWDSSLYSFRASPRPLHPPCPVCVLEEIQFREGAEHPTGSATLPIPRSRGTPVPRTLSHGSLWTACHEERNQLNAQKPIRTPGFDQKTVPLLPSGLLGGHLREDVT